ncbi:glycosyltransferase, family 1 [Malaciobacter marinus]|uniref:Glycosyltransferase WbuB n=1 Tax=Malaciobacter marinus TaxID=505249 RepID=A0A347TJ69_9BACT|nr:glycosyltransferase family 4 protein [Malaciobacter marinus]AXX86647.1 glycosyltransferase, family 1 [Malaciobacter marinus]PHO14692.1 glycosyltransferase WbuB [Malaciobacter marinus]
MRITLFHQYFLGKNDPGGSRWNEFTSFFSKKAGFITDVIAGNIHYATGKKILPNTWSNTEKVDEDITLYRTWTYSGYNSNFVGRVIGYLSYTFSSLLKALFLKKPDVYIVTSPSIFVGISAIIVSKLKRVPFIFEVRDLWPESAVATGVLNNKILLKILYWLEHRLYKYSKKIVVLTPAFKENIEKRYPEFIDKIEIITNGADFSIMGEEHKGSELRKKFAWGDKKVFTYLGAHGVANDLMQVVEAAKAFKEYDNIHFVLIGDGMQKKLLKQKASEYNLKNIEFIDSVPKHEVVDYVNASDVCMAILKKTDTFKTVYPNKVFDYMSCKKPVFVTIDGITRDLINEAKCGLYAEPENLEEFKKVVDKFLNMSDIELKAFGENGYKLVKEKFDREKLAERYIELIKEVSNA